MKAKTAPPQAPIAAPPPAAPAIKKVNLAGIGARSDSKAKAAYPILPDEHGEVAKLVADILDETDQFDALETSLAIKKAELKGLASTFYFSHHHGAHDVASSVEARCPGTKDGVGTRQVLVMFQNRYKVVPDESPISALLGAERTARFFRQGFDLKISGDKIPITVADELIAEVVELFTKHGASEALTAITGIKPTKDFHSARHSALTVEENAALELICPIVGMVKTKGRGEDK